MDDALAKLIRDHLKATFRRTPPEALTYLIEVAKEKVLPLLWKEGVPITEKELLDLFEDWFIRIGRFKIGSSTMVQRQKYSTDHIREPWMKKILEAWDDFKELEKERNPDVIVRKLCELYTKTDLARTLLILRPALQKA